MPLPDLLRDLLSTPGPSGREGPAAEVWRASAGAFGTVEHDQMGSSVVRVAGTGTNVPSLATVGHIDEIGVIVTHVEEKGFLRIDQVGGWDPQQLVGQRIRLRGRTGELRGVVGKKPIHLIEPDERKSAAKLKDLYLDIGAVDAADALSVVRIGDVGVIDAEPLQLRGDRVASRSMDNRIGSYVAHEVARLVAEDGGAPGEVQGWAVAQEETGLGGAQTTAHRVRPDIAVVVDVTFATDQPGIDKTMIGSHDLGSGPVIDRGSPLHPWVFDRLIEVAEAEGIPHSLTASGRRTGTDADAVHLAGHGIATAVVSVPLRYMHSAVETADLGDVEATARLIAAFARTLDADVDLKR